MRNRIDEVLKEQGKTYKDLVPLTGLSEYGIGKMAQAGDDEYLGAWVSLARALDVSPAYLVGWSDEPSEDEHKYDIESSDVFKAYMSKVEPETYYDFAKPKPTSGVKVTLDNGNVIYDERRYSTISGLNLCGAFLHLEKHIIDINHIVSIEKVEEDN